MNETLGDSGPPIAPSKRKKLIARKSVMSHTRVTIEPDHPNVQRQDVGAQEASHVSPDIDGNDYDFTEFFQYDSSCEADPDYEASEDVSDENSDEDELEGQDVIESGCESSSDDEWISSRTALMQKRTQSVDEVPIFNIDEGVPEEVMYGQSDTSDDEAPKRKPSYKTIDEVDVTTNFKALIWKVGMKFASPQVFQNMVNRYGVVAGYSIRWYKSEERRLAAKCKPGCSWRIYASWDGARESFVVKVVNSSHTCNRADYENIQLKPSWLAKEYLHKYKMFPNWENKYLICEVAEKYGVPLSKFQCYRTKLEAHKILHGSLEDHYMKLGSYMHELKRADPCTTIVLLTDKVAIPPEPEVFKRLYISFKGLREGFMVGCRPILCFDGCFLKTFLGGMLLCAIGRDGNNQMYPVAWAVVEAENNDSWSWFLEALKADLPGFGGEECTILSDQQKGLLNALIKHFPSAEHRNCARHIYANWHKKHKGDQMKSLFWKAAKAYARSDFDIALEEMKTLSASAAEDFMRQNPRTFCRSYLRTSAKTDVIVNNLAETFNGYILEARGKPVIGMMEDIRLSIMQRIFNKSSLMNDRADDICPRIRKRLEQEKEISKGCVPLRASVGEFQVTHLTDMLSVDLVARTCTCRKWDLSGIPCCHVIACCNVLRVPSENYVFDWFKKGKYGLAYGQSLRTVNGSKHWVKVHFPLVPPPIKIGAGRPKKNRRKDPHERVDKRGKLTKHGMVMTCSVCKDKNHNRRSCPQKDQFRKDDAAQSVSKKGRGRPRKEIPETSSSLVPRLTRPRGRPRKGTNTILPTWSIGCCGIISNKFRTWTLATIVVLKLVKGKFWCCADVLNWCSILEEVADNEVFFF